MSADLGDLGLVELRARRAALQDLDDAVSYARRVAQGRVDLVRAELTSRQAGTAGASASGLREVLADRLIGGPGRPPRPADEHSDHPLAVELDELGAAHGFGRLGELDEASLTQLADAIEAFEQRVSGQRQAVYGELDELTEELVRRLADARPAGERDPA